MTWFSEVSEQWVNMTWFSEVSEQWVNMTWFRMFYFVFGVFFVLVPLACIKR